MNNEKFPQYLHRPYQVLWFETDDMGLLALCFILAIIFGGIFWILLFVVPTVYMKTKAKYPRGYLRHLLYFAGVLPFRKYPEFTVKEWSE
ncbi:MAG: type IV conjugative transfer system protein TraL [Candidatus Aenigmatarchaeota archaeon]